MINDFEIFCYFPSFISLRTWSEIPNYLSAVNNVMENVNVVVMTWNCHMTKDHASSTTSTCRRTVYLTNGKAQMPISLSLKCVWFHATYLMINCLNFLFFQVSWELLKHPGYSKLQFKFWTHPQQVGHWCSFPHDSVSVFASRNDI